MTKMNKFERGFVAARELIRAGWCQHRSTCISSHGNVQRDTTEAMREAFGNTWADNGTRWMAREAFRTANRITVRGLADWNDRSGRTKAQVLRAFDRAIAYAKNMD